ncbi:hypothetical protein BBP40_006872 [Aspergillus hancockii]|nr:hypothetical protein BBP40_006872 [Aspergillus hancockii]
MSSPARPTDIEVKLTYLQWQSIYGHTRPYRIARFGRKKQKGDQEKLHNLIFRQENCAEIIQDIRGFKEEDIKFTLEANGFAYCKYPPSSPMKPQDFWNSEQVEKVFLPECEAILRNEIEGIDQVYIFDWKVSRQVL